MDGQSRRKLAAIVFTDIVGYSALSHRDEKLALALLEEHRQIVRPLVERFGGREIKTIGDAFFLDFASAVDAVDCSIAIQEFFRDRNRKTSHGRRIMLRIGIHLGDVVSTDNATDLHGDGVNIAARLQFLASQGGICISGSVYEQVHARISYPIIRMGGQHLKNIRRPVKIYRIEVGSRTSAYTAPFPALLRRWLGDWRVAFGSAAAVGLLLAPLYLQRGSDAHPIEARKRVAVLPILLGKADAELDYIAEGITSELTTGLSRSPRLRVLAQSSVSRLRTADKSPREIGSELSVGTLLSGSIRRSGAKLRLNVTLSDTLSEENLWSETFETSTGISEKAGDTAELYEIQKQIVARVLSQLNTREPAALPLPGTLPALTDVAPPSEAYLSYLKGKYFFSRRTEPSLRKAAEFFEASIQSNPRFSQALSGLADVYHILGYYGFISPAEANRKSAARASMAYALDPGSPEVLTHRADHRLCYDYDWAGAEEDYLSAIAANPNYATVHHWYGEFLAAKGDFKRARESLERAAALDPLSLVISTARSIPDYYDRQPMRAIRHLRTALELDPKFISANLHLGLSQLTAGDHRAAIESLEKAVQSSEGSVQTRASLATAYAASGKTAEARAQLAELQRISKVRYVSAYDLALIQTALGDREAALSSLEQAYRERASHLIWISVDPKLDPLRGDPRFTRVQSLVLGAKHL